LFRAAADRQAARVERPDLIGLILHQRFANFSRLDGLDASTEKKISRISTSEIWQPYRAPKIHGNCVRDLGVSPDDIRKCKVKRWALEPGIKER